MMSNNNEVQLSQHIPEITIIVSDHLIIQFCRKKTTSNFTDMQF